MYNVFRQHLQAAGGLLRRDTHRTDGSEGPDGRRSAGFHQARRLCHQRGRRYQRRRGGTDPDRKSVV